MTIPNSYAIYDFETTGYDTDIVDVIEIGVMIVRDSIVTDKKSWLIKIANPLPDRIIELTGITDQMLQEEGVDEALAFQEFTEMVKGLPLMGHNIMRYDNLILRRFAEKHRLRIHLEYGMRLCIDTAGMFKAKAMGLEMASKETLQDYWMRALNAFSKVKFNLSLAHASLGFDQQFIVAHRAMADVAMVYDIFQKMVTVDKLETTP